MIRTLRIIFSSSISYLFVPVRMKAAAFLKRHYLKLLQFIGFLLLWQIIIVLFNIKEYIIPSPLAVFSALFNPEVAAAYLWGKQISATLTEIACGFVVSAFLGILIAVIISWSSLLRSIVMPLLVFFNSIPKIAMAPLFLIWFGYGIIPNALIAILIAFFPVVINTTTGLNAVDRDLLDLVNYLHAKRWQVFIKIQFPNALPYIFSGLKISTTLCVVGAIIGEFIASDKGVGFILMDSQALIDTPPMFAGLIIIAALGLGLFGLISIFERLLIPWQRVELA